MVDPDSRIDLAQVVQRTDHQGGPRQQHQGQRDLRHDEEVAHVRRILIAYSDLDTWCLDMVERAQELLELLHRRHHLSEQDISRHKDEIDRLTKLLRSNRDEVTRVQTRLKLDEKRSGPPPNAVGT